MGIATTPRTRASVPGILKDVRFAWWLYLVTGCFAPEVISGAPCSSQGDCPHGQTCDLDTYRCGDATIPTADASPDTLDVDANPCDPGEELVAGACTIPLTTEIPPAAISPAACDTGDANTSRTVALDRGNRIYVAFSCGGAAHVVTSGDGGATASAPMPLGITGVDHASVAGGPRKVGYVATGGMQGVVLAVTVDGGATWSTSTLDTARPDAGWGIAVAARDDAVWVAVRSGGAVRVYRNTTRGGGAFAQVDVPLNAVYGDLVVDPQTGHVWLTGDSPQIHVRRSIDGGASFEAEIDPAGASYNYSDAALAGGAIFVTGSSQSTFSRIPIAAPATATTTAAMLPSVSPRGRAIAVAADEAVYVANRPPSAPVSVVRFPSGATTGASRTATAGTGPSVAAGPGTTAVFVYTETASQTVRLGVYVF